MVMVDIDEEVYKKIKDIIIKDRIKYPSLRAFVNITLSAAAQPIKPILEELKVAK